MHFQVADTLWRKRQLSSRSLCVVLSCWTGRSKPDLASYGLPPDYRVVLVDCWHQALLLAFPHWTAREPMLLELVCWIARERAIAGGGELRESSQLLPEGSCAASRDGLQNYSLYCLTSMPLTATWHHGIVRNMFVFASSCAN